MNQCVGSKITLATRTSGSSEELGAIGVRRRVIPSSRMRCEDRERQLPTHLPICIFTLFAPETQNVTDSACWRRLLAQQISSRVLFPVNFDFMVVDDIYWCSDMRMVWIVKMNFIKPNFDIPGRFPQLLVVVVSLRGTVPLTLPRFRTSEIPCAIPQLYGEFLH